MSSSAAGEKAQTLNSLELASSAERAFPKPWGNYLLDRFVETPAPESISWLPTAPGWFFLLALLALFIIFKTYRAFASYQANAYRRVALRWLADFNASDQVLFHQLPVLLKKVAMQGYGRMTVAALTGAEWERWLDMECTQCQFEARCADLLGRISCGDVATINDRQRVLITAQVELWIREHRGQDD